MSKYGGIILCGGKSSRMGLPKATLPFGDELMLQRVCRLLDSVVDELIVVAAPRQELPPLEASIRIVHDRREGRGPLEGLAAGLSALDESVEAAYVTACDVPLLSTGFVLRMFEMLEAGMADGARAEIAVPKVDGFHHPLSAVYRRSVLSAIEALLAADRLRPFFLFEQVATREIEPAEWSDVDPQSATLANLNHPADYIQAIEQAGLEIPAALRERLV